MLINLCNRSNDYLRVASYGLTQKTSMGRVCCRNLFRFTVLIFRMSFLLCFIMRVTGRGDFQVNQGQKRENQRLNKTDKQFKRDEDESSREGKDVGKDG